MDSNTINANLIYQVTFTQDDYIFLEIYQVKDEKIVDLDKDYTKGFYIEDFANNRWLVGEYLVISGMTTSEINEKVVEVVKILKESENYCIVDNYKEADLKELGYSGEEIYSMKKISIYDQIIINPDLEKTE